jgi:hypothetical protein
VDSCDWMLTKLALCANVVRSADNLFTFRRHLKIVADGHEVKESTDRTTRSTIEETKITSDVTSLLFSIS